VEDDVHLGLIGKRVVDLTLKQGMMLQQSSEAVCTLALRAPQWALGT